MPWQPLDAFRDATIPKLDNLRRASRAGLTVPPTVWARAADLEGRPPAGVEGFPAFPWIVRSGSPTEDTETTSNAGQLLSLVVPAAEEFAGAVEWVVAALPRRGGKPLGAVFVQPFVPADAAGVTFFDGFYFEETEAEGSNQALTSGQARGQVRRGHVQRGDAYHDWLLRVYGLLGRPVDLEWARRPGQGSEPVLLQVRPALFPIRRCETLSLANHKEILGDPPSPWMVGVIAGVSRPAMRFFERIDPVVAGWEEPYSIELGERAWLNFSVFFRLMDRWGLPRTMVTDGVGGEAGGRADGKVIPGRFLRSLPTFGRLMLACLAAASGISRGLKRLDEELSQARTLLDIQRVNVRALDFSVRTNFGIVALLSGLIRVRRALGIERTAEVVTQRMMAEYAELASRPTVEERLRGLDVWLGKYGHRGPLESDPCRPRFRELRALLADDLERGAAPAPAPQPKLSRWLVTLFFPLFWVAGLRERFRDRLMHWWGALRERILAEARQAVAKGWLDQPEDAFFLRPEDLAADPATWRDRVAARRQEVQRLKTLDLPATAPRDVIEAVIARAGADDAVPVSDRFQGIGLGQTRVVGTAVRAAELTALLNGAAFPETPVLVVETLEPSWAVVFPRFAAVVAELGGELSHASILLREAGIPAVVNARGAYPSIASGDLLRVDPARGEVRVEARHGRAIQCGPSPERA